MGGKKTQYWFNKKQTKNNSTLQPISLESVIPPTALKVKEKSNQFRWSHTLDLQKKRKKMPLSTLYCNTVHAMAWNGMLQCPVSHAQKVTHLNTSQYTTFARKGSPAFSHNLFIPFPPAWQGVTILPFIDGSSSKSLPTPGWDLSLMWSPQFNLSMRTYKKDMKTFSTRLMHQAPQRDSIIWPYEIHQPYSAFHVVKYGSV